MTGFLFGELPSAIENDQSPFGLRVFPEKKLDKKVTVKRSELLNLFENDTRFAALTHEDAVRVSLLLVAEVIFIGRGIWYNVPNHFLQLVEDFGAWNAYPWGEFLWIHFYKNLVNVVPRHYESFYKKKKEVAPSKSATYNLSSFIWAFKIRILGSYPNSQLWWNKDPSKISRALSWTKGTTFAKRDYDRMFGPGSHPVLELLPTNAKKLQPWFIASNSYFRELDQNKTHVIAQDAIVDEHDDDAEVHVQEQELVVNALAPELLVTSTSANAAGQLNIFAEVEALKVIVWLIYKLSANVDVLNDVKKRLSIVEEALNIQHPETLNAINKTSKIRPTQSVSEHFGSKVANSSSPIRDKSDQQQLVDEDFCCSL